MSTAVLFLKDRMRARVRASLKRRNIRSTIISSRADPKTLVGVFDSYNLKRIAGNKDLDIKEAVLIASNKRGVNFFLKTHKLMEDHNISLLGVVDPALKGWGNNLAHLVSDRRI